MEPTTPTDIENKSSEDAPWEEGLFASIEVPQADTLSHVKRITAYVAEGHQSTEELTEALTRSGRSYGERQGQFYRRAAVQLGMLHEVGKNFAVSALGQTLVSAPDRPTELRAMRKGFLQNPVLSALYDFIKAAPAGRGRGEIAIWLEQHTTLSDTSARRRVSSVVNWMTELGLAYIEGGRHGKVVPKTPQAQAIHAGRARPALESGQGGGRTVSRLLRYFGLL